MEARQVMLNECMESRWWSFCSHLGNIWLSHSNHKVLFMPHLANRPKKFISDLIDQQRRIWNIQLIKEIFVPGDIPYITSIPLSHRSISDTLIWPYSKDGAYSVWSSHHWLRENNDRDITTTSVHRIKWTRIWKLNIPPKMKIFFWRLLHNVVTCNVNLQKKEIQVPSNYIECDKIEDLHHTFIGCEWETMFWFVSPLGFRPHLSNSAAFLQWL